MIGDSADKMHSHTIARDYTLCYDTHSVVSFLNPCKATAHGDGKGNLMRPQDKMR